MDAVVSHTVYLNYNYFVKSCEYNKKLKSYNSTYMYIGHYWIKRMVHALLKGSYSHFVKEEQYVYIEQNRELYLTECEMKFRRKKYPFPQSYILFLQEGVTRGSQLGSFWMNQWKYIVYLDWDLSECRLDPRCWGGRPASLHCLLRLGPQG